MKYLVIFVAKAEFIDFLRLCLEIRYKFKKIIFSRFANQIYKKVNFLSEIYEKNYDFLFSCLGSKYNRIGAEM